MCQNLLPDGHRCHECPNDNHGSCPSWPGGNRRDFVILGESPGPNEIPRGRPLIGQSGECLAGVLGPLGIELEECFLINAINCNVNTDYWRGGPEGRTRNWRLGQRRRFNLSENCLSRVYREIFEQPRKIILALGNINLWNHTDDQETGILDRPDTIDLITHPTTGQTIQTVFTIHPRRINDNRVPVHRRQAERERFEHEITNAVRLYER